MADVVIEREEVGAVLVVLGSLNREKTGFVRAPRAHGDTVGVSPSEVSCWMKEP